MKKIIIVALTMMFWVTAQADVVCIYKAHDFVEVNDVDAGFYAHMGKVTTELVLRIPNRVGIFQGTFKISNFHRFVFTIEINDNGGIVYRYKEQTSSPLSGWTTGREGSRGPSLTNGKPGYDRFISYIGTSREKTRHRELWEGENGLYGVLCYIDEFYNEGDLAHLPGYKNFDNSQYTE